MNDLNEEQMEGAYNEAEVSDDEFEELSFDDLLDRVESNDPSLTKLKVRLHTLVQDNDDNRHMLDRLATAIGSNTNLKAVAFDELMSAQVVILFRGIACNQTIKRLHFQYCGEHFGNACRILSPLFKNNQVERIRIGNCDLSHESTRLLATSLAMFDSLKEFALTKARMFQHIPQEVARELMQSLSGHSGLRKLDLSYTTVGKLGCSALVDLLSNPTINLRVLDLTRNNLGHTEAAALASGMAGNTSLKEINFDDNEGITEVGWQAIFDALSSPRCRLEKLSLLDNHINDDAAQSFSNALTKLKSLCLNRCNIPITCWHALFGLLSSSTCVLEDLDLSSNQFNDEAMTSLTDALASNRSLTSLNLSSNIMVTGDAWQRFFSTVFANPSSGLEKLDLGYCDINNTTIRALTDALVNNNKLKVLDLKGDYHIATTGWERFSAVLENPNSALEELDLDGNEINGATLTSLMNSLAGNKTLKKLIFNIWNSNDWEPPVSIVCNAASIMGTYNSNHSLQTVGYTDGDDLPEEFESLLQINRENSPNQAARLKIIKTHFNKGFVTQPFVGMDFNVLPHAMAWMGRGGEVSNHVYGFIRSMASLFEHAPDEEK